MILDSGPGRKDEGLLSFLAAKGFHLLPGVPNTTHVTQPTDQNYRCFKSMYCSNLEKLVHYCGSRNKTVCQPDIPLLVFGKRAGWNKTLEPSFVFNKAFSMERSQAVWRKIGISPFTRQCLHDSKVGHTLILLLDGTIDLDVDPCTR